MELYRVLSDDENSGLQERLANCLTEEMELVCGVCHERYGDQGGNSLDALPCSHIFHAKYVFLHCRRETGQIIQKFFFSLSSFLFRIYVLVK